MRQLLVVVFSLLSLAAEAGRPQLFLAVARFRNLNQVEGGAEVEVYATIPTQSLLYRQRAPRAYQSSANFTLEILRPDGTTAYREVLTLKPPVLTDTTIGIKNTQNFLKRIRLSDGRYIVRGTVRDQYRVSGGETSVEQPLILAPPATGPFLSDAVLLTRPAVPNPGGEDDFTRGGYLLTRTAGGFYGRPADKLFFYSELQRAPAGQPLRVRYQVLSGKTVTAQAEATVTPQDGRPTVLLGQLPLDKLPEGEFTLLVEAYGGSKLLASQRSTGYRSTAAYNLADLPARP